MVERRGERDSQGLELRVACEVIRTHMLDAVVVQVPESQHRTGTVNYVCNCVQTYRLPCTVEHTHMHTDKHACTDDTLIGSWRQTDRYVRMYVRTQTDRQTSHHLVSLGKEELGMRVKRFSSISLCACGEGRGGEEREGGE